MKLSAKTILKLMLDEYEQAQKATAITGQLVSIHELIRRMAKSVYEAQD